MEQEWAPPDDPVFRLVPLTFGEQAAALWVTIGEPEISSLNFWDVYLDLLEAFRALPTDPQLSEAVLMANEGEDNDMPIVPGLRELRYGDNVVGPHGYRYFGGLENPPPLNTISRRVDLRDYADFSD